MQKDWKKLYEELKKKQDVEKPKKTKNVEKIEGWLSNNILIVVALIEVLVVVGATLLTSFDKLEGAMYVTVIAAATSYLTALLMLIKIMVSPGNKLNGGGNHGL